MIGIYKIENLVTHKVYIGQTINFTRRVYLHLHYLESHKHCNMYLQRAWDKDGSENFEITLFEDLTSELKGRDKNAVKKKLDERERFWIKHFKSSDSNFGYNLSEGGDGATLFGERNPSYGKKKSEETRKKISNTIRLNGSHSGKRNGRYGKEVSKETRAKISQANSGRQQSQKEKDKRNETMKKLRSDPQFKAKMRAVAERRGLKSRKYTDEFIQMLRNEYKTTKTSIVKLAKKYNIPKSSCQNILEHLGRFRD